MTSSTAPAAAAAAAAASNTFFVGAEGGRIFRCLLDTNDSVEKEFARIATGGNSSNSKTGSSMASNIASANDAVNSTSGSGKLSLKTPIKDAGYVPHAGAVFGVDCSPFIRELFVSGGSDGSLRLFHALRASPILNLEPSATQILDVKWSPHRPAVFAASTASGAVLFYDLIRCSGRHLASPLLSVQVGSGACHSFAFNPILDRGALGSGAASATNGLYGTYDMGGNRGENTMGGLVATGDNRGSVQIWRLPEALSQQSGSSEAALLRELAAAEDAGDVLRRRSRSFWIG